MDTSNIINLTINDPEAERTQEKPEADKASGGVISGESATQGNTATSGAVENKGEGTGADVKEPGTRRRISGAQKRRLQKERRKAESGGSAERGREASGPGASRKRPVPDHMTPSPSSTQPQKKTKGATSGTTGTFAQAASKMLKLAIVADGYPERRLSPQEALSVRRLVKNQILEVPDGTKTPAFEGVWERDGAVVFGCTDEETGTWLKALASTNQVGDIKICAVSFADLEKRHRVVVHINDPDLTTSQALHFMQKQNRDLDTKGWIVVRGSETKDADGIHFAALIGEKPLQCLRDLSFKPFCGLIRAAVKLIDKDRSGIDKQKEGEGGRP